MQKSTRTFLKSRSAAEPFVPLDISRDLEGSRFHLLNISEPASFNFIQVVAVLCEGEGVLEALWSLGVATELLH